MRDNSQLLQRVAEIYDWLDLQIKNNSNLAAQCEACGRCCDFENFDHHLFVTPPEVMYLAANLSEETVNPPNKRRIKPMPTGLCPYNIDSKCSVYKYRFAGCRIFCCKGNSDFQSQLSELALKKFKSICTELQIPYRYTDWAPGFVAELRRGRQTETRTC